VGWILVLCLPGVSLAFLVGVLRRRLHAGSALQRLSRRLRDDPNVGLPVVIGEAIADPSLEVAYWMPGLRGQWVDEAGRSATLPGKDSARSTKEVRGRDGPLALLIHDRALDDQEEFLGAVGTIAGAALENRRLAAQVDASLEELHESRARIQAAADAERERMERDLHDGAQQRLVALRVRVELAGELMGEDQERDATLLRQLGSELDETLDEVRALARGIYPPLLADRGIVEALRAVGRRHPVQTTIEANGVGRYPPELERAVYFCCLEALQNAAKHASTASTVSITLLDDGAALRFAVRDDGIGFAAGGIAAGQGLTNMRDRLAAVGGELAIESAPGEGTSVLGVISRSRSG
ncbi:MAG TPA: histidine kinase, partial [Gaiellaceae bacterium]